MQNQKQYNRKNLNNNELEILRKEIGQLKLNSNSKNNPVKKIESGILTICFEIVSAMILGLILGILLGKLFNAKLISITVCLTLAMAASFKTLWQKFGKPK